MKIDRPSSSHPSQTGEAAERAHAAAEASHWHVGATEGTEADRRRSLRQEIAEIEAKAIGDFEGGERILQNAREVARQLATLGADADDLVRHDGDLLRRNAIDTQA